MAMPILGKLLLLSAERLYPGRAVADPVFQFIGNDGGKTGVDITLLAGMQGLVHWHENVQKGIGSEVVTWLVNQWHVVCDGPVYSMREAVRQKEDK